MSLSPYTMSGLVFTGMGVDVNTKKIPFKFSIFYGRFLKATPLDSGNLAAYERWGWGFKTDYISKRMVKSLLSCFDGLFETHFYICCCFTIEESFSFLD